MQISPAALMYLQPCPARILVTDFTTESPCPGGSRWPSDPHTTALGTVHSGRDMVAQIRYRAIHFVEGI